MSVEEHCFDRPKLNNLLKSFYTNVRMKDGSLYSKNSLVGVARSLLSEKKIDVMSDNDFCSSNETFLLLRLS